jgi:hypothetical protein
MSRKPSTFYVDEDLVVRTRAAVAALENTPHDVGNMSAIVERLLRAEIENLEKRLNAGQPFPQVKQLPRGSRRRSGTQ